MEGTILRGKYALQNEQQKRAYTSYSEKQGLPKGMT
jgi:hypothetical protein